MAREGSLPPPPRVVERARVVVLVADRLENMEIAQRMSMTPEKVACWRNRFLTGGIAALENDSSRWGGTPTVTERRVKQLVDTTLHDKPANATHLSTRTMARAAGISEASVRRIKCKPSSSAAIPVFQEKLENSVGLYLNPPEHATVLSADEEGACGIETHDYKRNGTFSASKN